MSAQVKLDITNPGIPARLAATSGTAGASQAMAAIVALTQPVDLVVQPRHRLGMDPDRQLEGCRPVGRVAVAGRIHRAGVRDVRTQLDRPRHPLPPVVEQVRVRPDRDRESRAGFGSATAAVRFRWPNPWLVT